MNMKKAVIKSDIKTGKKVAGFIDNVTGEFEERMEIHSSRDIDVFMEKYNLSVAEIRRAWKNQDIKDKRWYHIGIIFLIYIWIFIEILHWDERNEVEYLPKSCL